MKMNAVSNDENQLSAAAGADLELLDLRPPPLTRNYTLERDELLPGASPFSPIEPVVNGEPLVSLAMIGQRVVAWDIFDILRGDVPEDELQEMGWADPRILPWLDYETEQEDFPDSDDGYATSDDEDNPSPPPGA